MSTESEIAELARQILDELTSALEGAEDLREVKRAVGVRLRTLLTIAEQCTGGVHQARLKILRAIGRTEIGDQIRRGGACHTGAERSVELAEDADLDLLTDGLRQLADLPAGVEGGDTARGRRSS